MKLSSRSLRADSGFSDSVHRQLNSYALAATAAGVGLLALAQPSEARIVYTKTHHVIGPNHVYELDLNHDGTADFEIEQSTYCTDFCGAFLFALPAQSNNGVVGTKPESYAYASALKRGVTVGPKQPFAGTFMASTNSLDGPYGRWVNVSGRYLGLKFRIKGKVHYGWARLNVTVSQNRIVATLTGYAYETIPNKPIVAGKTEGSDDVMLEPLGLGSLAQGSAGLAAWHPRK